MKYNIANSLGCVDSPNVWHKNGDRTPPHAIEKYFQNIFVIKQLEISHMSGVIMVNFQKIPQVFLSMSHLVWVQLLKEFYVKLKPKNNKKIE
jgi:hypothetical protein